MRRSITLLALIASAAAAPIAFAQDQTTQTAQTDAGAPAPTVTASSTATAPPPAPIPAPTQAPIVVAAPPARPAVSEETVYQLGRLVELEADRARNRRYFGSAFEIVGAGTVIASGALEFTLPTSGIDPNLVTVFQVLGGVEIGLGVAMALDGVISLFVKSPMERMFEAYAPVAVDKSMTPAERLRRGEGLLEQMANRERAARITGIASSVIAAALETGIGIWLVADNDFWGNDPTSNFYRPFIGAMIGLSVVSVAGEAIARALWERGPAELAWEHWRVSHEPASAQTSRIQIRPMFAPTVGGAVGGLRLVF